MKRLKGLMLLALASLATVVAMGQEEKGLAEALVHSLKVCAFDPIQMQVAAARMEAHGIREDDCDSLLNAEFLWREAWNYLGAPVDSSKLLASSCPDRPSPLYYAEGFAALRSGAMEEAQRSFEQAVAASLDEPVSMQTMALQGLGNVQLKLLDYPAAITSFERAYELVPDNSNPAHLNSLAYVNYLTGACEKSIEWANLGMEVFHSLLEQGEEFNSVFVGDMNALLLTKLQTAMVMGDSALARETAQTIRLDQPFDGRELAAVNILTRYAQWINDRALFASYRVRFQQWMQELDSVSVADELGANRGLFEPWSSGVDSENAWDDLRSVPLAFRGGLPVVCKPSIAEVAVPWEWGVVAGLLGALLALVASLLAVAWMLLTQSIKFNLGHATTKTLQELVQQAISSEQRLSLIRRKRALCALGLLMERQRTVALDAFPGSEHWTDLEKEVAIGLINGEQSKDLAQRLHVSMSTIYNVRHGLRTRFKLDDEVMLVPWLRKQASRGGGLVIGWLMLAGFAAPNPPGDQLRTWLEAGDSASWNAFLAGASDEALREAQREVPAGFEVFYQRRGERPAWANIPDSVLWDWGRSGIEALKVMSVAGGEGVDVRFDTKLARERLMRLEWRDRRLALSWLLAVDGLLAVVVLGMWFKGMGRPWRFGEEWEVLRDAIESTGANVEAELKWKLLLAERSNDPVGHDLWELLTTSEQEMARLLGQSIPVNEIAKRMACSPSYVYNLRSQIRQKWQLDPADNLVDFIHRVQSGDI